MQVPRFLAHSVFIGTCWSVNFAFLTLALLYFMLTCTWFAPATLATLIRPSGNHAVRYLCLQFMSPEHPASASRSLVLPSSWREARPGRSCLLLHGLQGTRSLWVTRGRWRSSGCWHRTHLCGWRTFRWDKDSWWGCQSHKNNWVSPTQQGDRTEIPAEQKDRRI